MYSLSSRYAFIYETQYLPYMCISTIKVLCKGFLYFRRLIYLLK